VIFVDTNVLMYAVGRPHPARRARDLVHLACSRRRGVRAIKTFDRGLAAAARDPRPR
jgi:predicted nucleic acid-binding protein